MNAPRTLTAIEPQIRDGYVLIPKGMTPVYLHELGDRTIAYVEDWTAEREYDANRFDLYLLTNARQFVVSLTDRAAASRQDQRWYDDFGEPTKEAIKINGELTIREHTKTAP
jgi:hypothetical protein